MEAERDLPMFNLLRPSVNENNLKIITHHTEAMSAVAIVTLPSREQSHPGLIGEAHAAALCLPTLPSPRLSN